MSSEHSTTSSIADATPNPSRTSPSTVTSTVFVINALEKISHAKEARKNKALGEAVQNALDMVKNGAPPTGEHTRSTVILTALQMAIDTRSESMMTIALDCLGKFIAYNYLGDLENESAQSKTMAKVVDVICSCFTDEDTDEKLQLQIVKTLLDAVYSTSNPVHHSALLSAVHTTYDVFLLSRNHANQNIAQVTLTQMIDHIFRRVKIHHHHSSSSLNVNLDGEQFSGDQTLEKVGKEEFVEEEKTDEPSVEDNDGQNSPDLISKLESHTVASANENGATAVDQAGEHHSEDHLNGVHDVEELDEDEERHILSESDRYIRDAVLVFRYLCRRSISSDSNDVRSLQMRSKLLSLHLILTVLTSHMDIFISASVKNVQGVRMNPFIPEVKKHLCLSLARNAFSVVPNVFDITLEILWKVIQGLRVYLKKELEVFFKKIVLGILEMRNSSFEQRYSLLKMVLRLCSDPKTLVDIYLNYDCDGEALDNIYERLVNILCKITTSHIVTPNAKDYEGRNSPAPAPSHAHSSIMIPPPLTSAPISPAEKGSQTSVTSEKDIKFKALECLVSVLESLVSWCEGNAVRGSPATRIDEEPNTPRSSEDHRMSSDRMTYHSNPSVPRLSPVAASSESSIMGNGSPSTRLDDPEQFENQKHRKQLLQEAIRMFNWKPEKGLQLLEKHRFIDRSDPINLARFFLHTEGLNKVNLGEFLGEKTDESIATMHALVDEIKFTDLNMVDALRHFLQPFRLPGEAQKIDRFMEKFADRFVHDNPTVFKDADTAYRLAFSVIMLNTDLHNSSIKKHMTVQDFIRNNQRIDDNGEISEEMSRTIFKDILNNEIKLNDEVEATKTAVMVSDTGGMGALGISGLQNALVSAGLARDIRREAYQAASEEMGSKTEAIFKNMLASRSRSGEDEIITFYSASHVEHVRPMFDVAWTAFMTGISGPLQESDDMKTVELCLNGFKNAIRIICLFHTVQSEDMDLQRNAFITTLTKFTFLSNLNEMKPKNVEAIRILLEIAAADGNYLKDSWKVILSTVSQLERFQLITSDINQSTMPDIAKRAKAPAATGRRSSSNSRRSPMGAGSFSSSRPGQPLVLTEEVASAGRSQSLIKASDRLFTTTVNLNGDAIVDFVKALCETSWKEIVSSAHLEHPRMYSLQKLVEISYYNMNRIRMEWSNIWVILGDYFNKVGCQSNFNVAFFALDSLRQLSMQFLEKEELPHFKFQKDFLMPFRDILMNNPDVTIKDMVLRCLLQMIQARAHHIRSGWKTMLLVFTAGARESSESIVHMTFDIIEGVSRNHFVDMVTNETFPDYIACLVEFAKNKRFQKISLPALDRISETIERIQNLSSSGKQAKGNEEEALPDHGSLPMSKDEFLAKCWLSVSNGLREVTMDSSDVEVRNKSLQFLFELLKKHGSSFQPEFWNTLSKEIIFPLFDDLKGNTQQHAMSGEDFRLWLSTTMIAALRNVVDLYSYYFDTMKGDTMNRVLELFSTCITQDNDIIARAGCECLELYIETNVEKFDTACWNMVTKTLVHLFEETTANGLFEDTQDLVGAVITNRKKMMEQDGNMSPKGFELTRQRAYQELGIDISDSREQMFQKTVEKCVLHLLLIQTVSDLLRKDPVFCSYPSSELMALIHCLEASFHFAKRFNADDDLREALWRFGFMKQLPNLLKQETYSGGCYVSVLMRMYANLENIPDREDKRQEIEEILIPLCNEIFSLYSKLDIETKPKNIAAWTPVLVSVLNGLSQLQSEEFLKHVPRFYLPAVELLTQDSMHPEVRKGLFTLLKRIGHEKFDYE